MSRSFYVKWCLLIGRISSASPQLGAAKRGPEAGIAQGWSPPTQPRLPPEPKGLPEGAQREPANGTPGTEGQKTNRSSKSLWPASNVNLDSSSKRQTRSQARCTSSCRRVRNDLGYCTKCVPWLAMTIWYLQRRYRWPMSGISTFPPELKSPLPIMQMEHTRSCSSTCVGYEHAH